MLREIALSMKLIIDRYALSDVQRFRISFNINKVATSWFCRFKRLIGML